MLDRHQNAENRRADEADRHYKHKDREEGIVQSYHLLLLQTARRVNRGELVQEGGLHVKSLPNSGDGKEQEEWRENAAEIQVKGT